MPLVLLIQSFLRTFSLRSIKHQEYHAMPSCLSWLRAKRRRFSRQGRPWTWKSWSSSLRLDSFCNRSILSMRSRSIRFETGWSVSLFLEGIQQKRKKAFPDYCGGAVLQAGLLLPCLACLLQPPALLPNSFPPQSPEMAGLCIPADQDLWTSKPLQRLRSFCPGHRLLHRPIVRL